MVWGGVECDNDISKAVWLSCGPSSRTITRLTPTVGPGDYQTLHGLAFGCDPGSRRAGVVFLCQSGYSVVRPVAIRGGGLNHMYLLDARQIIKGPFVFLSLL